MKRIYTILVAVLITASVFAQTPQKMTYQAVVRDNNSTLITSTQVGIEINIYQGSTTGTLVYTETQTPTTNVNGLLSIEIGGQTGFDTITWANGPYFIETNIDPSGGSTYTITGVSQLLTVPYALHAKTAESITGGANSHYVGELYGGGIVYYVSDNGQHGLIASLDDLDGGSGVAWSATDNVEIGATAQSSYNGATNTAAIVAQDATASYAATLCNSYTGGSQTDWYLPANWELNLLYNSAFLINTKLENDGDTNTNGLSFGGYWSSTEYNSGNAWFYNFSYGNASIDGKSYTYRVRAVRAF